MATTDTLINRTFDERYVIKRKLGAGGMADVYLAEDQELGRRVAIKILNDRHAADDSVIERFRREAKNAGCPCREWIAGGGPPPTKTPSHAPRQFLAPVGFAQKHAFAHREIKPHHV